MNELCSECAFWDSSNWHEKLGRGDCRRHAPTARFNGDVMRGMMAMRSLGQGTPGDEENLPAIEAVWPSTHQLDWCGEFEKRKS